MNIQVYNLSLNTGDRDLRRLFSPFGIVVSAEVARDKLNGRSKCKSDSKTKGCQCCPDKQPSCTDEQCNGNDKNICQAEIFNSCQCVPVLWTFLYKSAPCLKVGQQQNCSPQSSSASSTSEAVNRRTFQVINHLQNLPLLDPGVYMGKRLVFDP